MTLLFVPCSFAEMTEPVIVQQGSCGKNVTYVLYDNGHLEISGRGAMTAYKSELQVPWFADRDKIKKVTLSNDVTTIGGCAFAGCRNLTEININGYITEISDRCNTRGQNH